MVVRISESTVENFTSSGSAIFYHAADTTVLSFDRTRFKANSQTVVHSQGTKNVAIRNCDGLAVEDFTSVSSLLRCDDLDAAEFCPADLCSNEDAGISCYCLVNDVVTDPLLGSCSKDPQISVPVTEVNVLANKPHIGTAMVLFTNIGDRTLDWFVEWPTGSDTTAWSVTPSKGEHEMTHQS